MTEFFEPISTETIPEKISSQILKLITSGEIKTGESLPSERKLSEMFKVSRASIREALKYLEIAGFIQTSQGKRTVIKNSTEEILKKPLEALLIKDEKKIIDLTKVRVFLESYGARDAAINRNNHDLQRLETIIFEMESDLQENILNFKTDFNFHMAIATATKNIIYIHIIETVHNLISSSLKFYREILFTSFDTQLILLEQHKTIFDNILKKEPEKAEKSMRKHLEFVIKEYYKWINK